MGSRYVWAENVGLINHLTVTIDPAGKGADLSVTETNSPDPATLGSRLTYTIIVRNNGPSPATDAVIVDNLSGHVQLLSATSSQGRCSELPGLVVCAPGTLANGATVVVTIVVIPKTRGLLSNTVYVGSLPADPMLANNQATVTTRVR